MLKVCGLEQGELAVTGNYVQDVLVQHIHPNPSDLLLLPQDAPYHMLAGWVDWPFNLEINHAQAGWILGQVPGKQGAVARNVQDLELAPLGPVPEQQPPDQEHLVLLQLNQVAVQVVTGALIAIILVVVEDHPGPGGPVHIANVPDLVNQGPGEGLVQVPGQSLDLLLEPDPVRLGPVLPGRIGLKILDSNDDLPLEGGDGKLDQGLGPEGLPAAHLSEVGPAAHPVIRGLVDKGIELDIAGKWLLDQIEICHPVSSFHCFVLVSILHKLDLDFIHGQGISYKITIDCDL